MKQLFAIASRMYQIVRPVRSRHYLAFVRSWPCIACGTTRRYRDAAHVGPHGISQKACDLSTIPACRVCHRELHRLGPVRFQLKHGLDFAQAIESLHHAYEISFGRLPGEESARAERRAA